MANKKKNFFFLNTQNGYSPRLVCKTLMGFGKRNTGADLFQGGDGGSS
jgi:hypothetical protein